MAPQRGHALVMDDHTYMRGAIAACLSESGATDITEVTSLAEARAQLANGAPEIAVVDLRLPDGSALDLIPDLTARGTKVVVFTSADDSYSVRTAYAAGASGYLLKNAGHDLVLEALRAVLAGQVHVDPSVASLLVESVKVTAPKGPPQLSARDLEVLQLAADGLTNNQIAERLGVTPLAVKGQFVRIGRKLGATDRTQMVVEAMRADLLR